MKFYSVNDALENKNDLHNTVLGVFGLLRFEFENESIIHWPKSEQNKLENSGIWIFDGTGSIKFNRETLTRWSGKRIKVIGVFLSKPETGFGHLGGFEAALQVYEIDLYQQNP